MTGRLFSTGIYPAASPHAALAGDAAMVAYRWLMGYSGVLVIEVPFSWPGIGRQAWEAITNLDVPLVLGTVLFGAVCILLANIVVDIAYVFLDPRVRYGYMPARRHSSARLAARPAQHTAVPRRITPLPRNMKCRSATCMLCKAARSMSPAWMFRAQ